MPICPNGHQSATDDWCEVCGMRMVPPSSYGTRPPSSSAASSASTPPASASPPGFPTGFEAGFEPGPGADGQAEAGSATVVCPQCGTPREGAALFCEECRYNFRTQTATVAPTAPDFPPPYPRYESQASRPSQINRPAEPLPSESVTVTSGSGDFPLAPPSASPAPDAFAFTAPGSGPASAGTPPAAAQSGAFWLAVIAPDREYFTAMMGRSGPEAQGLYFPAFAPEVQLPLVGPRMTIGRRRHGTGAAPDIDLSRAPEDPGVSHRHAVLVQQPDGTWSVVDQDSTNGTTVNLAEDPIRPYTPVPLAEGDRVHVGAWTTITLHRTHSTSV